MYSASTGAESDIDYEGMLRAAGFVDVTLVEATENGPLQFQERIRASFDAIVAHPTRQHETLTKMPGGSAPTARYPLISAYKSPDA